MNRLLVIATLLLFAAGCSDGADESGGSELDAILDANSSWPYEVTGVLEIVEAGGWEEDSDIPDWAVGSLVNEQTDEVGIGVEIMDGVARRANVDVDSGRPVKAWLEEPKMEYGWKTYPVSRLEAL